MRLDIWTDKYKHEKKYLISDNYDNVNNLIRKQNKYINIDICNCCRLDIDG